MNTRHLFARLMSADIEGSGGAEHEDIEAPVEVSDKPREPTPYEKQLRTKLSNANRKLSDSEGRATAAETKLAAEIARITGEATAAADAAVKDVRTASDQRIIRAELKTAALRAGMRDPGDLRLVDLSKVTLGEDGEIVVPEGFFEGVKASKPYLFTEPKDGPDTGFTSAPATPPAPRSGSKSAKDMSPDEYKASLKAMGIKL